MLALTTWTTQVSVNGEFFKHLPRARLLEPYAADDGSRDARWCLPRLLHLQVGLAQPHGVAYFHTTTATPPHSVACCRATTATQPQCGAHIQCCIQPPSPPATRESFTAIDNLTASMPLTPH